MTTRRNIQKVARVLELILTEEGRDGIWLSQNPYHRLGSLRTILDGVEYMLDDGDPNVLTSVLGRTLLARFLSGTFMLLDQCRFFDGED